MAEGALFEQLDLAVQTLLDGVEDQPAPANAEVAALARVASRLRHLPSDDFRARLRSDLQRRVEMTSQKPTQRAEVKFREGFRTVTPYLAVPEVLALLDFVREAFDAEELLRAAPGSEGGIHAEVRVGDSIMMVGGGGAWRGTPKLASLHLYVPEADDVYRRALAAGATSLYPPTDMEYGDREAGVIDLCGNQWFIATHRATGGVPPGMASVTAGLRVQGAAAMLDFLQRAFGAEESGVYKAPDGTIVHAKVRIGTSLVEIGEAHGQWQPLPSMFYLYVPDVDAWYQRALAAGAESISEPGDQPYGDRVGAVGDPYGHLWYIGTPIVGKDSGE